MFDLDIDIYVFFNTIEYLKGTAPLPRLKTGNAVEFHWKETQTLEYIAKGNISWTGCKKGDPPPQNKTSVKLISNLHL